MENKTGCAVAVLAILLVAICIVGGVLAFPRLYNEAKDLVTKVLPSKSLTQEVTQPEIVEKGDYSKGSKSNPALTGAMGVDTVKDIVEMCGDSVVKIEVEMTVSNQNAYMLDPWFQQFFGSTIPESTQKSTGSGSGFLFTDDGYILTNYHVIENADKISVYLTSSLDPYEATVVGTASELDLAVIKIEGEDFPYIALGDSDEMAVGDWVVAIGNPYGLDHTVTVGVISATGRPITIEGTVYQNLLQTDAAINPGNSGGPMLNLKGEVIGINCATSSTGQGIGFAIPSNTVLNVVDELKSGLDRTLPYMGVTMQDLTQDLKNYFGLSEEETGVVVYSVSENSPAEKAGLQRGDILIAIDDQPISASEEVSSIVKYHSVGDQINVTIYREGEKKILTVTLEALNQE